MAVVFYIPGPLRAFAGGSGRVEVEGTPGTLREALEGLWAVHPGIRDRMITEQGQIRAHINVFVGSEDARYTGGLATPLTVGAEISILPAVSGGARPESYQEYENRGLRPGVDPEKDS